MTCKLCKQHYPKIDGAHYDEGGFLPCEDEVMLNKDQAAHDNDQLHMDVLKDLIRDALKDGPGFAKDISQRIGEPSNVVVRLLHEMEDDMEVSFTWLRGYKI